MALPAVSTKRIQINKANTVVVVMASLAAFMVTFTFFAGKALLSQRSFQSRVIKEKAVALKQLEANIKATESLENSYKAFVGQSSNVIGGSSTEKGDRDGDNAKIILDALPSKYDFPAMATSLEKLFRSNAYKLESITGSDDEVAQAESKKPELVEMPFTVVLSGSYEGINEAIITMERSIRPFHVNILSITATDKEIGMTITAKTFYQPEKLLNITTKEVK